VGNIPDSDLLHMKVKGDIIKGMLNFKFSPKSQHIQVFLDFSDLMIFSISLADVKFHFILGIGCLKV
jgi:hypothetical protein